MVVYLPVLVAQSDTKATAIAGLGYESMLSFSYEPVPIPRRLLRVGQYFLDMFKNGVELVEKSKIKDRAQ